MSGAVVAAEASDDADADGIEISVFVVVVVASGAGGGGAGSSAGTISGAGGISGGGGGGGAAARFSFSRRASTARATGISDDVARVVNSNYYYRVIKGVFSHQFHSNARGAPTRRVERRMERGPPGPAEGTPPASSSSPWPNPELTPVSTTTTPRTRRARDDDETTTNDDAVGNAMAPPSSNRALRVVARAFVGAYYRDLNDAPDRVARYYTEDSVFALEDGTTPRKERRKRAAGASSSSSSSSSSLLFASSSDDDDDDDDDDRTPTRSGSKLDARAVGPDAIARRQRELFSGKIATVVSTDVQCVPGGCVLAVVLGTLERKLENNTSLREFRRVLSHTDPHTTPSAW